MTKSITEFLQLLTFFFERRRKRQKFDIGVRYVSKI